MSAGDHYLSYKASYVHVQRTHGPISRCGRQAMAKYALFVMLVASAEWFEVYWDQFFADFKVFFHFTSLSGDWESGILFIGTIEDW